MKKVIKIVNTLLLALVFGILLYLYFKEGPMAVVNVSTPSIAISLIIFVLNFVEITMPAKRHYKVSNAPGAILLKLVRRVYSQKTVEEVFEPTQRDFLDEYADAISDYMLAEDIGTLARKGWWVFTVRCRYYFAFCRAVLKQNFVAFYFRKVYQLAAGK